jgi:hypothetical protein
LVTVRLKLSAAASDVRVATLELFNLVLQLLELSSLMIIKAVMWLG